MFKTLELEVSYRVTDNGYMHITPTTYLAHISGLRDIALGMLEQTLENREFMDTLTDDEKESMAVANYTLNKFVNKTIFNQPLMIWMSGFLSDTVSIKGDGLNNEVVHEFLDRGTELYINTVRDIVNGRGDLSDKVPMPSPFRELAINFLEHLEIVSRRSEVFNKEGMH